MAGFFYGLSFCEESVYVGIIMEDFDLINYWLSAILATGVKVSVDLELFNGLRGRGFSLSTDFGASILL